ncbi:MAG: NADPH-dependent assimilatory sulfite reductase hemoprotein subunit, partial [Acidimicrobiales bacterium]
MTVTPSPAEALKATSRHLRGPLAAELADPSTERFSAEAGQILKFHGVYAQDDRDQRRERKRQGLDLAYSCMVRCSVPGGVLRRNQWLAIDSLADRVGNGGLRLTTRQGVQFHFVHKGELTELVGTLNRSLITTYAACGDVVRNIMATTAPTPDRDLPRIESVTRSLVGRLRPRSDAYWELWLDGERAVSAGPAGGDDATVEPVLGDTYLPRKFKIGVAWPGDHSIDVHSQDLGLVLQPGADGQDGAVVLAGGGLGRSHTDDTTFPWLAEPLAWVPDEDIGDVAEAVVTTFRDHGNRADRSHARLKYLVAERGIAWLRGEVEDRIGRPLAPPVALAPGKNRARSFGWQRQRDGLDGEPRWFLHLPIPSGRLVDDDQARPRAALRRIVSTLADEIRITPHQDVLLCGVRPGDQAAVDAILAEHGVRQARELPLTVLSTMACPALPTCGLALGEAERVLPE